MASSPLLPVDTFKADVAAVPDEVAYRTRVVCVQALTSAVRMQMQQLYLGCYDGSSATLFQQDLQEKDEVILLYRAEQLVGFTALMVYPVEWQGCQLQVVYSGDTIVHPAHWGQQALAFAWIAHAGHIQARAPGMPLYWFLLVKGHRTFRYLSAFSQHFHPHWGGHDPYLHALADHLATARFGDAYCPQTGVVAFARSHGHLRHDLAGVSPMDLRKTATRFFLERNPRYAHGEELVCLCRLSAHNLKPMAARIFSRPQDGGSIPA